MAQLVTAGGGSIPRWSASKPQVVTRRKAKGAGKKKSGRHWLWPTKANWYGTCTQSSRRHDSIAETRQTNKPHQKQQNTHKHNQTTFWILTRGSLDLTINCVLQNRHQLRSPSFWFPFTLAGVSHMRGSSVCVFSRPTPLGFRQVVQHVQLQVA